MSRRLRKKKSCIIYTYSWILKRPDESVTVSNIDKDTVNQSPPQYYSNLYQIHFYLQPRLPEMEIAMGFLSWESVSSDPTSRLASLELFLKYYYYYYLHVHKHNRVVVGSWERLPLKLKLKLERDLKKDKHLCFKGWLYWVPSWR